MAGYPVEEASYIILIIVCALIGFVPQYTGGNQLAEEGFVRVGSLDNLSDGDMMQVKIGKQDVLIANLNGKIHASSDVCPHQFYQLSTGDLDGDVVRCSLHGAEFDLKTGEQLPGKYNQFGSLPVYEVRVTGSEIWVKNPAV